MLHHATEGAFEYDPTGDASANLARAFDYAAEHYGIARILDPADRDCCSDEKAMVTYLSEFMHKLSSMYCTTQLVYDFVVGKWPGLTKRTQITNNSLSMGNIQQFRE